MENKLEKNKCQNCPLKSQRPDLTKKIVIENLTPFECNVILAEIADTIKFIRDIHGQGKEIKVTSC